MPARNIVVCANGNGVLASRLKLALAIATRLGSEIQVLAFRSARPPSILDRDFPGMQGGRELDGDWERENAAMAGWRATYDLLLGPYDTGAGGPPPSRPAVSAQWIDVYQPVAAAFPPYARACDLIVAGGRSEDLSVSTLDDEVSKIALLQSGRLALFAATPAPDMPDPFAKILVAWDDGPAAARAIAQAIPVIAAATSVRLLAVEADPQHATPCNQILAYLRQHAPNTAVRAVALGLHTVGHTILEEAERWGASLIIMGAYEHSRGREIIFGGTTRFVIGNAKCPVLMAR